MDEIEQLKNALETKKIVYGTGQTIKSLRQGKAETIFITKTCTIRARQTIEKYAKIENAQIVNLQIPNEELGVICKKPFHISVLATVKGK